MSFSVDETLLPRYIYICVCVCVREREREREREKERGIDKEIETDKKTEKECE